jgi:hypothetical protein
MVEISHHEAIAIKRRVSDEQAQRMRDLTDMIAMGWGSSDQEDIPANWRTVRGPDNRSMATGPFGESDDAK